VNSATLDYSAVLAVIIVSIAAAVSASAAPLTQVTSWGTLDLGCTTEGASCADDYAFTPSDGATYGGYRAGGSVSWAFTFDPSAFASISSITMDVLVVGLWPGYTGNVDPNSGQIGDYFAIDDLPFAPFLGVTDGRDSGIFNLTASLSAGLHTFSVVAFDYPPGPNYEGWAGVDIATLTVTGEGSAIPEPSTWLLLFTGLGSLLGYGHAGSRRRAGASRTRG
jgi:hypothetical protein